MERPPAFTLGHLLARSGPGVAGRGLGRLSSATLLRVSGPLSVIAALLTASTVLFPGLDEVHRWIELGPVRLHASAVAVPWVFLGMSAALHRHFSAAAVLAAPHVERSLQLAAVGEEAHALARLAF